MIKKGFLSKSDSDGVRLLPGCKGYTKMNHTKRTQFAISGQGRVRGGVTEAYKSVRYINR